MMKPTIVLIIAIAFTACKKEGLHSTWNVNGDGFSTDKVAEFSGKGGSGLGTDDKENGFTMNWGLGSIPGPGVHQISIEQNNNPALLRVSFNYKGAYYLLSKTNGDSLIATKVNGKMHYEMPSAWFKNYSNAQDSVLIKATLIQP